MNRRVVIFVDMDMTLVDYHSVNRHHPHAFAHMLPMKDAIHTVCRLAEHYDIFIVSSIPTQHGEVGVYDDKLNWLRRYLGAYIPDIDQRFMTTYRKDFLCGDYLIDDGYESEKHGIDLFPGTLLHFTTWKDMEDYFFNSR
jgi:5'(3')-deoxyribonucleotidase